MRVLHVIGSLDPDTGGPAVIAGSLAAAQAAMGHAVCIATILPESRRQTVATFLAAIPGFDRVALESIECPTPMQRLGFARDVRMNLLVGNAQVVHLHGIWDAPLIVAARECRLARKPYAVLLNGMLDPWSLGQKTIKKKIALMMGYRRMLDGAAFLHLGNVEEQTLIAPLRLRSPGVIIPNGVFPEQFAPGTSTGTSPGTTLGITLGTSRGSFRRMCQDRLPGLGDAPFVLFLSRLHFKKGLDILADAFALVAKGNPVVHLVVAGPDGGARGAFEAQIAAAGLSQRVHVIGPLYGEEKLAALSDATCFCLPSRQEGFSMAITEALACGVPVVISENCHFPEVARAGAGLVVGLESGKIAEALLAVLSDPNRQIVMRQAGKQLVASHYTWPAIARQTVVAYEQAMTQQETTR